MNALSTMLTGISIVAAVSVAGAQSDKKMDHAAMNDTMRSTYTGCLETVNHGASYILTHIADDHMAMMHGEMAMPMHEDSKNMKDDGMMKEAEPNGMNEAGMHVMAPSALVLKGTGNLRKYTGQQVKVTGSLSKASANSMPADLDTLNVSSLKVVAKACPADPLR